ncbi:DegT/DnrJ/EryC1/StrS family aminotransferase [Brachybacterium phenoliresistens]|uniref:DegT/DnrJ/EryC1/StrS family aminotransferase n=1 Tax=Brachybacterium phenoliresistens TaxID=396014 RepID=UPI0031D54377
MRIGLSVPDVGPAEQDAMSRVLAEGWIAPVGPDLDRFEQALCARTGRARAVAVSSGTAALHLQLLAAGIGPGEGVICPTLTFVATANAITYTGATPILVDCDDTGNIDPDLVEEAFESARHAGTPVRAVLPVDVYGKVADHRRLGEIADRHGALLMVDAAESLGARRDGVPAGKHGMSAAVSFNGNKIITTSSGGAVLTDDHALADRVLHLATQAKEPVAHFLHREVGYAYRMSNVLAALGTAQLTRLDDFLAARRGHRARYTELCDSVESLRILGGADDEDNCWLTVLELTDPGDQVVTIETLAAELASQGIETRRVFTPLHRQPLHADPERTPRVVNGTAERLFATCLAVPSSARSSSRDIDEVCGIIEAVMSRSDRIGSGRTRSITPYLSSGRSPSGAAA